MSTVGTAATSAGGYMYIRLCMYIMFYYTVDVYVLYYVLVNARVIQSNIILLLLKYIHTVKPTYQP
jgi:hypothetical protein